METQDVVQWILTGFSLNMLFYFICLKVGLGFKILRTFTGTPPLMD